MASASSPGLSSPQCAAVNRTGPSCCTGRLRPRQSLLGNHRMRTRRAQAPRLAAWLESPLCYGPAVRPRASFLIPRSLNFPTCRTEMRAPARPPQGVGERKEPHVCAAEGLLANREDAGTVPLVCRSGLTAPSGFPRNCTLGLTQGRCLFQNKVSRVL